MESTSFYLTLPSNASMDIYEKNTQAEYQIRLARTLYLQNKYEVALAEIQYPHTWQTLRKNEEYKLMFTPDHMQSGHDRKYFDVFIPNGYYNSLEELANVVNRQFLKYVKLSEDAIGPIRLEYDKITRKTSLILKDNHGVIFTDGLGELFGFTPWTLYVSTRFSPYTGDITHGFHSLYVYCSICEPQIVGDYYVPLLRAVAIEGNDGEFVNKIYDKPHYVTVNTSKFDSIEVNIKDDTGENVAFKSGKVICKLHFRSKAL